MGTYLYTLRKKKVTLWTSDCGHNWVATKANLYSYAYKPSYSFLLSARYNRMAAQYEKAADAAFADYNGGFVINGTAEDGLDGCPVYIKVRSGSYLDCCNFPGEIVGFVEVRGGRNYLVTRSKWTTARRCGDDTKFRFRNVIKDGKCTHESEELDEHSDSPVCG